jgi:hypothetical protein
MAELDDLHGRAELVFIVVEELIPLLVNPRRSNATGVGVKLVCHSSRRLVTVSDRESTNQQISPFVRLRHPFRGAFGTLVSHMRIRRVSIGSM